MKYIKSILVTLIITVLSISCVNATAKINFKEYNKGDINIEMKISSSIEKKEKIEDMLKNVIQKIEDETKVKVEYTYEGSKTTKIKNFMNGSLSETEAYIYNIHSNFEDEKQLQGILSSIDEGVQFVIEKVEDTKEVKVSIINSSFINYDIKVNGKLLTLNGEEIKENKDSITFNSPVLKAEFTYKETSNNILYLIISIIIIILLILLILLLIFRKKIKKISVKDLKNNFMKKVKKESEEEKKESEGENK